MCPARMFELFLLFSWIPLLDSDRMKKSNEDGSHGAVFTNEFCGYERFMARCNHNEVILVRNASFGRMRAGRCVTGDYSHAIGCSSDVTNHVSNMCTGRQNCSFLVAMMDSVAQPCAKDFKSYLEASYVCHKASFLDKNCGDNTVVLTKTEWSGYISLNWRHLVLNPPREFGSICTWRFTVQDGRRIELSWVKTFQDIPPVKPTPSSRYRNSSLLIHQVQSSSSRCPLKMWVFEALDNEISISACQDISSRHRIFYTSLGNSLTVKIQVDLDPKDELVSFFSGRPDEILPWHNRLLHFRVIGCPKVEQSGDHTTWQHGDSAAVVCASSGKTWYLTCREGKWIGFVGNCSKADHKKLVSAEASNMSPTELSNGAVMAVLVGVVTGFAIGMLLLFAIVFTKRSYRRGRNHDERRKKLEIVGHGFGNNYLTMSTTDNDRSRNSFVFKQFEDCLQSSTDINENNNNNKNNSSGRSILHKNVQVPTSSDVLTPHPKAPLPLLQTPYGQTLCAASPASEPIKRRSNGHHCNHRQCPNLPDFLTTCNSPNCTECCLCTAADNFLVNSHADDFHNFNHAAQNLCNHDDGLERSLVRCSKDEISDEPHCSPSPHVPAALENVCLLSHPKHDGWFARTCQFSVCPRLSPSHRSSLEACECNSIPVIRVQQNYVIASSGHNSQFTRQGVDVEPAKERTNKMEEEPKEDCVFENSLKPLDG